MLYKLYLRKSRADLEAEARGEGETLARHEKILLDLAKRLNLHIGDIAREIVSGETIASRPEMQKLLSEVEQGMWEGVLVVEIERLARGATIDQGIVAQAFKYSNTKIITPNKTYDPSNELDEEFFEFALFMSRREYKTITRRMQSGRLQSAKEGKYVGNIPPYGYNRIKLEKQKGYTLAVHPEQSVIVKMIYELYVYQRIGVSLIVRKLNELKIPPAKGDVWVVSSIQTILRNPVYVGKIRWNSRPAKKKMVNGKVVKERPRAKLKDWLLVDGLHEAIIDQETFDLAQKYLAENPSRPCPKEMPVKNPLAGLIICGVCGRKMVRRPYVKKGQPDTLMCPSTACSNVSAPLACVENVLIDSLEKWLAQYKLNWELPEREEKEKDLQLELKKRALKKLDEELLSLEKQLGNIHDLLEQGVYTTETFLERSRLISDRTGTAKKERESLINELDREEKREQNQKIIIPEIEKALEIYCNAQEPIEKNKALHIIVEKAVYIKTVKGRWHNKPDDFKLDIYMRRPR